MPAGGRLAFPGSSPHPGLRPGSHVTDEDKKLRSKLSPEVTRLVSEGAGIGKVRPAWKLWFSHHVTQPFFIGTCDTSPLRCSPRAGEWQVACTPELGMW